MSVSRMKGKTLSPEKARQVVESRRSNRPYKLLESDLGSVGDGEWWDESRADSAVDNLCRIADSLQAQNKPIDAFGFDRVACATLHQELDLPPNLAASDDFWRWLSVEKFGDIVEARHAPREGFANLGNYGIGARVERNRIALLWLRADILYDDSNTDDPYHLAKRYLHTDFLESGIVRPRYGWCRNLARVFVQFQYRDPNSNRAYLHSTDPEGIRAIYKRLRRVHSTISFEFMSDDELRNILMRQSKGLKRARHQ